MLVARCVGDSGSLCEWFVWLLGDSVSGSLC